ncbi:NUDIX hydrolase [Frigoribacterium sp. SL97]|uniref:NUDIX hydrolase n=1 Tax=Frigoribacterium sp. SL97 TaxID=2994664 RepID=UPI00226EA0E2|nr:NUDIX hydrolase [Frigoribacterium sp. SL97]WAC50396.1 NUDIX hydrolase [Frigoribacterium sp. SL97]
MMLDSAVILERAESALDTAAMDRALDHWASIQAERPWLFDGPIVAAIVDSPHSETVTVRWYPSTYSRYLARDVAGDDGGFDRALFASVVVRSRDGLVLFGAMADTTSSPGRMQLPGGNVELASDGSLDEPRIRAEAARELREETGIAVEPATLRPHRVSVGDSYGDVGFLYRYDSELTASELLTAVNGEGEFARFVFADPAEVNATREGHWVDYAEGLLVSLRDEGSA